MQSKEVLENSVPSNLGTIAI